MPEMPLEFRVVDEEHNRVNNGDAVGDDVQNVLRVREVQFLLAIAKVLYEPHNLMR